MRNYKKLPAAFLADLRTAGWLSLASFAGIGLPERAAALGPRRTFGLSGGSGGGGLSRLNGPVPSWCCFLSRRCSVEFHRFLIALSVLGAADDRDTDAIEC